MQKHIFFLSITAIHCVSGFTTTSKYNILSSCVGSAVFEFCSAGGWIMFSTQSGKKNCSSWLSGWRVDVTRGAAPGGDTRSAARTTKRERKERVMASGVTFVRVATCAARDVRWSSKTKLFDNKDLVVLHVWPHYSASVSPASNSYTLTGCQSMRSVMQSDWWFHNVMQQDVEDSVLSTCQRLSLKPPLTINLFYP